VVAIAGYHATTSFTCGAGVPAGSICRFSAPSVTPNGDAVTSFLIVETVAPTTVASFTARKGWNGWWQLSLGAGLASLVLIAVPGRKTRRNSTLTLLMLCIVTFVIGCGGGGGATPGPTPTPVPSPTPVPTPTPKATTTSLVSSNTKVAAGDQVTLSATVTALPGSSLSGTVTFLDIGVPLGPPVNLIGGAVQLQVNTLSVGTHAITARYNGDSANGGSTSSPLNQVVTGTAQFQITANGGNQTRTAIVTVLVE
jgi:Bacterial Ig-like domain (group 3)